MSEKKYIVIRLSEAFEQKSYFTLAETKISNFQKELEKYINSQYNAGYKLLTIFGGIGESYAIFEKIEN
jgi:hypothetical protein